MLISPVVSLSSITQKIEAYKFEFDGFLDTSHMISILLSNCTLHHFAFLQAVADIIVRRHFDSQVHPVCSCLLLLVTPFISQKEAKCG
jgi:hypothetical protein